MKDKSKLTQMLLLIAYLILGIFSTGRWSFFLAAWVGPVIGLRYIHQAKKGFTSYLLLALATYISLIISWNGAMPMPPVMQYGFFLVTAAIGALPFLVDRWLIRRINKNKGSVPTWTIFLFPLMTTAVEFFSTGGGPLGTFGASAYSQSGFLPIMQLSSIFGLWIIPFLIGWFASTVNRLWEADFKITAKKMEVVPFAAVMLVALVFGSVRPVTVQNDELTVNIAGISLKSINIVDLMQAVNNGDTETFMADSGVLRKSYLDEAEALAKSGNQIVVLPEGAGLGYAEDVEAFLEAGKVLADEHDIYFVMPTFSLDSTGENSAVNAVHVIDPDGEIVLEHIKYGGNEFEGSVEGSGQLQAIETPYGTLSAVICWDADFPATVAQAGAQDVELLIIPANDWYAIRDIHAGMSVFRAIENGTAIFRQTSNGVSLAADAYGRTINRVDGFEMDNVQKVELDLYSLDTLYPQLGDLFGLVSMIGFVVILVVSLVAGRKRKEKTE